MTKAEAFHTMRGFDAREKEVSSRVVTYARALVPTLKDAGREHAARDMEALLFDLDATLGERDDYIAKNFDGLTRALLDGLK